MFMSSVHGPMKVPLTRLAAHGFKINPYPQAYVTHGVKKVSKSTVLEDVYNFAMS